MYNDYVWQGIFEKIQTIVSDEISVSIDDVTISSSFQDDLGADSLALVELIMALEENFNLESIPDEDAERIKTVNDAVDYIYSRLKK